MTRDVTCYVWMAGENDGRAGRAAYIEELRQQAQLQPQDSCLRLIGDPAVEVVVMAALPVVPYVRQTHRSRWRRDAWGAAARRYNDFKAGLRDGVNILMAKMGWDMITAPVGFEFQVGLVKNAGAIDLDNLCKALLDALQGALIKNDTQVWRLGPSAKHRDTVDWLWCRFWILMPEETKGR